MNLLIVDDESIVIDSLISDINWSKLGITGVYTAFNIRQAKELFESTAVDIMLCDIEMPQGSGLDLLEWVREHSETTESIIMTCHADFHFAKRAMKLGSLDYILKPLPYEELEIVVAKAADKIIKDKETVNLGEKWFRHQSILIERFWIDVLNRSISLQASHIEKIATERSIPFCALDKFVPVLINIQRWHKPINQRDERILEYALKNTAEEMMKGESSVIQVIPFTKGSLLAIISFDEANYKEQELNRLCEQYITACRNYFFCDLTCYIGLQVYVNQLPELVDELIVTQRNNVAHNNKVIRLGSEPLRISSAIRKPDQQMWTVLLREGSQQKIVMEAERYLVNLAHAFELDASALYLFQQFITQTQYYMMRQEGAPFQSLFGDVKLVELSENATRSIPDFLAWISGFTETISALKKEKDPNHSVIEHIMAFITQHLDMPLTREEIAQQVYLNPDYLDRLCKREKGMSVTELLVLERLKLAESLLLKTEMPVSRVAVSVGYSNLSHFSRRFKKHTGMNPLEYRLKSLTLS